MNHSKAQLSLEGIARHTPVLRRTPKGVAVCTVTVDVHTTTGHVLYFDVEFYGIDAEDVAALAVAGAAIEVEARAVRRTWEDKATRQQRSRVGWKCLNYRLPTPEESVSEASDAEDYE